MLLALDARELVPLSPPTGYTAPHTHTQHSSGTSYTGGPRLVGDACTGFDMRYTTLATQRHNSGMTL